MTKFKKYFELRSKPPLVVLNEQVFQEQDIVWCDHDANSMKQTYNLIYNVIFELFNYYFEMNRKKRS